ncbi:E3 ubiquitin-protein ligase pellino homolog 3 isoform X1 [Anolis carolinensis]|uniref:E3 ubiquitin-protein ligase pellino homolog 3 isoform X1 n=2 Tax=Anolis carolinensis TaxID=28377 RepID=UPI002F2B32ED
MVLEGSPEAVTSQSIDLRRACPKNGRLYPSAGDSLLLSKEPVKYGELIVLGYNGSLPNGDKGRRRSRLALFKRPKANGVKPDVIHHISTPLVSKALSNKSQHSISYTLSRSHSVIVEYTHDSETDMFQIGRSTESMIDFVVTDTASGSSAATDGQSAQSTISRFACRVICERSPPYTARIYAAGFDASRNIFLGVREGGEVEDSGRADGRLDHQWGAGHAPQRGLQRGLHARRVARDFRVRERVRPARQPLCPAAGQTGGVGVERAAGRLADRPLRGHAAVADLGGAPTHANAAAAGGAAAGDQRGTATVPGGLQHAGLPQPGAAWGGGEEAALGLRQLRPRPRLPQLGLPQGERGPGAGMPHVPAGGPLRAALAGLRGRALPGRRAAHPRLLPLRPRLLRQDCTVLGPDPAAPWHPRLPCRLPLLRHLAHWPAGLRPAHLPGAARLRWEGGRAGGRRARGGGRRVRGMANKQQNTPEGFLISHTVRCVPCAWWAIVGGEASSAP